MKKVLNKNIIVGFLLGMIITSLFGVSAATLYNSNQVSYRPSDDSLNVSNVGEALDNLYSNLTDGLLGKSYQTYKRENASPTTITLTVPTDCEKGFLVVERYGYNSSDVTITITNPAGMKTSTQLLSNYGYGAGQAAPMSVWYAEFIPDSTITISAHCASYSLGTTIATILY